MKPTITPLLLLSVAVFLNSTTGKAQEFRKKDSYRTVGLSLNAMNYFGDVVPKPTFSSLRAGASRLNVGLSLTQRLATRLSVRAALAYGRITGEDAKSADPQDASGMYRYHRNINFRNDLVELSAVGVVDLVANRSGAMQRPTFVPYVFGGVAVFHHNPKGRVEGGTIPSTLTRGEYVPLQALRTEGQAQEYRRTQVAVPFGLGARYRLNKMLDISLEVGWRKTFTDYLDDVSGDYTAVSNLSSDAARYFGHDVTRTNGSRVFNNFNAPGSMRGSSGSKDWYIVSGLTLSYILAPKSINPRFR